VCQTISDGAHDFRQAAFPSIFLLGGLAIIVLAVKAGSEGSFSHGAQSVSSNKILLGLNSALLICGVFLIFGPGTPYRTNILGFQLLVFVALAFFASLSKSKSMSSLLILFGLFTWLGLIGSLNFLNYNNAVWEIDSALCNVYFGTVNDERCLDTGFLQVLRVLGSFAVLLLGVVLVTALAAINETTLVDGKKTDERSDPLLKDDRREEGKV